MGGIDMRDTLDKIINSYMDKMAPNEEPKKEVARLIRKQIIAEIRPKIEREIYDSMKEKIQKEMEEKRTLDEAQHLKNLMIEGILLAFIVGMIVNQFTDIISVVKTEKITIIWWFITIGISSAFIILVIFYIGIKLFNSIIEIMRNVQH